MGSGDDSAWDFPLSACVMGPRVLVANSGYHCEHLARQLERELQELDGDMEESVHGTSFHNLSVMKLFVF